MCAVWGKYDPTHISNILKDTYQPIHMRFLRKTSNMVCNKVIKSLDYITSMVCKVQKKLINGVIDANWPDEG